MLANDPTKEFLVLPPEDQGPVWKPVVYKNIAKGYQVSDRGGILSPGGKLLVPTMCGDIFRVNLLCRGGKTTSVRVDRLVLSVFDHPEELMSPRHADGEQSNNRLDNLSWGEPTQTELAGMKAAVSRGARRRTKRAIPRQVDIKAAAKAVGLTSSPSPAPKRGRPQKGRPAPSEVEVVRVYRVGDLSVQVTPEGGIPDGGLPQPPLTPRQVMGLAAIFDRIAEMNSLTGLVG